jgi:hypothetical protein
MTQLARLVDPEALDADAGPRAKLTRTVPRAWLSSDCTLTVVAPKLLGCATCDGGGCDGCAKSGAHRIDGDDDARRIAIPLRGADGGERLLRLVEPFGPSCRLRVLLLELREGESATEGCAIVEQREGPPSSLLRWAMAAVVLLVALGVLALRR